LDILIGPSQLAFLKGHCIFYATIAAHEVLHHVHSSKESNFILKLDFEKVFDNVDWSYLLTMFKQWGFNATWISWMEHILWGGHSSVILNDTPGAYFGQN
jgi:Reverse transcriptase (RNA-dependent DNA polymerase)